MTSETTPATGTTNESAPVENSAPSAAKPSARNVSAAVEDVGSLKEQLKQVEQDLKTERGRNAKAPELQAERDRLRDQLSGAEQTLNSRWGAFLAEGARRGMSAAQLLEQVENSGKRQQAQTVTTKASRADALEIIVRETRADPAFAGYLNDMLDAGMPVNTGNIEPLRSLFKRTSPASPEAEAPSGGNRTAPKVPSGAGGPSRAGSPVWQPGQKLDPVGALKRGFSGDMGN